MGWLRLGMYLPSTRSSVRPRSPALRFEESRALRGPVLTAHTWSGPVLAVLVGTQMAPTLPRLNTLDGWVELAQAREFLLSYEPVAGELYCPVCGAMRRVSAYAASHEHVRRSPPPPVVLRASGGGGLGRSRVPREVEKAKSGSCRRFSPLAACSATSRCHRVLLPSRTLRRRSTIGRRRVETTHHRARGGAPTSGGAKVVVYTAPLQVDATQTTVVRRPRRGGSRWRMFPRTYSGGQPSAAWR